MMMVKMMLMMINDYDKAYDNNDAPGMLTRSRPKIAKSEAKA